MPTERYLFRVRYAYEDGTQSYESVCVQSTSETDARSQVADATERYRAASAATRTATLLTVTPDV